ncbi:hypothetical protein Tco_0467937 [Tanacetum coccineum]
MIVVNNQKDLVSPLPFSGKKNKVKSQTVTPTLPKSQGPEASESLPQKRKKPQSKKTPRKPRQHHPQANRGKIQLAGTGLPFTLNEGTRKSQPLPEGTTIDPKDSVGNKQTIDMKLPSTASNEGTAKTTSRPEGPLEDKDLGGNNTPADMEPINPIVVDPSGTDVRDFLLSDDEAQESDGNILGAGEEVDEDPQAAAVQYQSSPPQADKPKSSTTP